MEKVLKIVVRGSVNKFVLQTVRPSSILWLGDQNWCKINCENYGSQIESEPACFVFASPDLVKKSDKWSEEKEEEKVKDYLSSCKYVWRKDQSDFFWETEIVGFAKGGELFD